MFSARNEDDDVGAGALACGRVLLELGSDTRRGFLMCQLC